MKINKKREDTGERTNKMGKHEARISAAKSPDFEPRIVVFACRWCSYAGADLAGVSRIQYSPQVRLIKVLCSGRITPTFILKAFQFGADGVLVTGCHLGECHYISGNKNAQVQVQITEKIAVLLGMEVERLKLEWISASEGAKFARTVQEFTELIKGMGPSPLKAVQ